VASLLREILALVQRTRFIEAALRELRLRYDAVELDGLPARHWSASR
jgi:hypothetical protein